jgi:hypothetical protein
LLNNIAGILAPQVPTPVNSYESIATVTVGSGGTSAINFSLSGVSGYKHLQVRALTNAGGEYACWVNGDTSGSNYNRHYLLGLGSGSGSAGYDVSYGLYPTYSPSTGAFVQDFLDYESTNKNKVTRSLWGYDANGSGYVGLYSGLWRNTAAITSIQYVIAGGGTIPQYSSFALYGIKG